MSVHPPEQRRRQGRPPPNAPRNRRRLVHKPNAEKTGHLENHHQPRSPSSNQTTHRHRQHEQSPPSNPGRPNHRLLPNFDDQRAEQQLPAVQLPNLNGSKQQRQNQLRICGTLLDRVQYRQHCGECLWRSQQGQVH